MRKIWGLLSLCWLLTPSQGKTPGAQCVIGQQTLSRAFSRLMLRGTLFQSYLGDVVLPDTRSEDPASPESGFIGLQVVNAQAKNVSVKLPSTVTENGFFLVLQLDIRASAFLDGVLSEANISVEAKLQTKYALEDFSAGTFRIVFRKCGVQLGAVNIKLLNSEFPVSALPTVQESLTENLPAELCPRLRAIFDQAKQRLLRTVNVALPFGSFGTLRYRLITLPAITDQDIRLNFKTQIVDNTGLVVSIPEDAVFVEAPPIQNYKLCLGLQESLLNLVLSFLVKTKSLHLKLIPEEFSGALELKKAIEALIPSQGSGSSSGYEFPSMSILDLMIIIVQSPEMACGSGKATLQLVLKIEVTLFSADRSHHSVLTMMGVLDLDVINSVLGGKLVTAVSLSRLQLLLESSEADISGVFSLVPHWESLLSETLVPLINADLQVGLPLPSILSTRFSDSTIQAIPGAVVVCV